jgi:hypothetical protein
MTVYPCQTWTMLGQLCAALWDSQSRPEVLQPGFEPGTVVTSLALRCSALDRCATREPEFDYVRPISLINVLIEITDCFLSACCPLMGRQVA